MKKFYTQVTEDEYSFIRNEIGFIVWEEVCRKNLRALMERKHDNRTTR